MTIQGRIKLEHLAIGTNLDSPVKTSYQVQISQNLRDPAWDAFLEKTPGGHHVQTSLWAQIKDSLGWRPVRLIITRDEEIVAGAQVLLRSWPIFGAIGYVSKGPLLAVDDPELEDLVITELQKIAKRHRIQFLAVQPPDRGKCLAQRLICRGFRPSSNRVAPTATVLLDLSKDLDTLMAEMKSKTRYNIRLGQRKGVTVREGTERDLPSFFQLLSATGQRQGFVPIAEAYFLKIWQILSPRQYCKLFLAEYETKPVSALLAIPFGDTVIYKRGGWSGCCGQCHPNEVIHWAVIKWAKSHGYRYYDFEGVDPKVADGLIRGEPLPASKIQTVTRFKIGFGGQVILFPGSHDYIYDPALRTIYYTVYPKIMKWKFLKKAVKKTVKQLPSG